MLMSMYMNSFFSSKVNIVFLIIAIIIIAILQFQLWKGETGIIAHHHLKQQIVEQQEKNKAIELKNRILFAEMEDLKTGYDVIEEYARLDLGLIKKNETFVQLNMAKVKPLPEEFLQQEESNIAPMMDEIAPEIDGQ